MLKEHYICLVGFKFINMHKNWIVLQDLTESCYMEAFIIKA